MKLYIAGPMTGLPEWNYPAFEAARETLVAAGFDVLCPTGADPGERPWPWYMRRAIAQLVEADGVAVLPDAACSRGALVECQVARALEMPIMPVDHWVALLPVRKGGEP